MITVLVIFLAAFLAGLISGEKKDFSWDTFIFVFTFCFLIFVGLSYCIVYTDGNIQSCIKDKMELEKIVIGDREIYLAMAYEDEAIGYIIKTNEGFMFLAKECKVEIIEDEANHIILHTKTIGGIWSTLFFSDEVVDYYEVHIPMGCIMHKEV